MTMDDFSYFAHAFAGKAPPVRAESPSAWRSGSDEPVTAAVISKPKLIVATVYWTASGSPRFSESKSALFELEDRSARALRDVFHQLEKFVKKTRVRTIYLRSSSAAGEHAPHLCHFKIEAAIQLLAGLDLLFVNTLSVSAWARRHDPQMPATDGLKLGRRWDDKLEAALETALFVNHNLGTSRYFSDGSARRD